MSLSDESWKDSYDRWKLASPYDDDLYDDQPEDECQHPTFEIDWQGRAYCDECPHSWMASPGEIAAHQALMAEHEKWCRQQARREFWRGLSDSFVSPFRRMLERLRPRKSSIDDDLPF